MTKQGRVRSRAGGQRLNEGRALHRRQAAARHVGLRAIEDGGLRRTAGSDAQDQVPSRAGAARARSLAHRPSNASAGKAKSPFKLKASPLFSPGAKLDTTQVRDRRGEPPVRRTDSYAGPGKLMAAARRPAAVNPAGKTRGFAKPKAPSGGVNPASSVRASRPDLSARPAKVGRPGTPAATLGSVKPKGNLKPSVRGMRRA